MKNEIIDVIINRAAGKISNAMYNLSNNISKIEIPKTPDWSYQYESLTNKGTNQFVLCEIDSMVFVQQVLFKVIWINLFTHEVKVDYYAGGPNFNSIGQRLSEYLIDPYERKLYESPIDLEIGTWGLMMARAHKIEENLKLKKEDQS